MNRYNPYTLPAESNHRPQDEQGSASGSDDGSGYAPYSDAHKTDTDPEDGSLTSQTLNADGTPKRPMNAFMIFARRRRPQVSSENQSMRTGEISKILSKEWTTMLPSDKQFYLDQAKQLKETFNSRYPDYVYRRRPNNSRKRRRGDVAHSRAADGAHGSDHGDDLSSTGEHGESSHTDGEEPAPGNSHSSLPLDLPPLQNYNDRARAPSRGSFSYSGSDSSYRPSSREDRLPFISGSTGSGRVGTGSPSVDSPRLSQPGYGYQSPQPPTMYGGDSNRSSWDSRMQPPRDWMGNATRPGIHGDYRPKSSGYSSTPGVSSWPGSSSPAPGAGASDSAYPFSTLSSPFYPSSSLINSAYSAPPANVGSYSSQNHIGNHHPNGEQLSMPDRYYNSSSPPMHSGLPGSHFATSASNVGGLPPQHSSPRYNEHSSLPRGLPPMQSISGFNHSPSLLSQSPPYWARDKIEGH